MPKAFVFDTNVLLSALLFKNSKPTLAYEKARPKGFLIASTFTFEEFKEVLLRSKFDKYLSLSIPQSLIEQLSDIIQFIEISESISACRDPKDDKFLELAVNAKASCIITGDDDLLVLNPFRTIPILTPVNFNSTF